MTHEGWLEAGAAFVDDDTCAYCGQPLDDRTLVDSYAEFLATVTRRWPPTSRPSVRCWKRIRREIIAIRLMEFVGKTMFFFPLERHRANPSARNEELPAAIAKMEAAARLLDPILVEKQGNLTEA